MYASDTAAYFDANKDRITAAAVQGHLTTLHRLIGPACRTAPTKSVLVRSSQGIPAASYAESQGNLRKHFDLIMDGRPTTLQELTEDTRASYLAIASAALLVPRDIKAVPSPTDVARCYAKLNPTKALSNNGIGRESLKRHPAIMAQLYAPIMVKAAVSLDVPVQALGGDLAALPKAKHGADGAAADCHRDVTIVETTLQPLPQQLRQLAKPALNTAALPSMYGAGINGSSPECARLHIQARDSIARYKKQSLAVLYIDARTAFAVMMRLLLIPDQLHTEACASRLTYLGFKPSEVHEITQELLKAEAWCGAGMSPHHEPLLTQFLNCTRTSMEGVSGVSRAYQGTLAGSSLGDLCFCLAMLATLTSLRKELLAQGLVTTVDVGEVVKKWVVTGLNPSTDVYSLDASLMDDVAIPIIDTADRLVDTAVHTAAVVDRVFRAHGHEPNYAVGKTQLLVQFIGKRSARAKRHMAFTLNHKLDFISNGVLRTITVIRSYKHMGSTASANARPLLDIALKIKSIGAVFGTLKKAFLRNDAVAVRTKAIIVQSRLLSRSLYQANCWPTLNGNEFKKFHVAVMKVYRAVAQLPLKASDDLVISTVALPAPRVLLASLRLSLFARIIIKAPTALYLALLAAAPHPESWLQAITDDFQFLCRTETFKEYAGKPMSELVQLVHSPRFSDRLAKACAEDTINLRSSWARTRAERELGDVQECDFCPAHSLNVSVRQRNWKSSVMA